MAMLTVTTRDRGTETSTHATRSQANAAAQQAESRKEVVSTKVTTH